MAGSAKRGVEFARADLFRGATCILTPTHRTDPDATRSVEAFWKTLGMQTVSLTPEEHDRRVCDISHLPHLLAAALVAMQDEASLPLAGPGFLDVTRIAAGDGGLWRDIFLDNRDSVLKSLGALQQQLDSAKALLHPSQSEALAAWLDQIAARRNSIPDQKVRESHLD